MMLCPHSVLWLALTSSAASPQVSPGPRRVTSASWVESGGERTQMATCRHPKGV